MFEQPLLDSSYFPYCYRLNIAYEGTYYSGWQRQPNAVSIQEIIEDKLSIALQMTLHIAGAGRTDAGVHALGQVAHMRLPHEINTTKICQSLNSMLPPDIRIITIYQVLPTFHAQKSAVAKEYHYVLVDGPIIMPFDRRYAWHIHKKLDHDLLQKACKEFIGTYDFRAFANENTKGAAAKNSIRTIYSLYVVREPFHKTRIIFYGNGFLYKMVRNIAGMLVAVALKKRELGDIHICLQLCDRKAVGIAAPACGLTMMQVYYPSEYTLS